MSFPSFLSFFLARALRPRRARKDSAQFHPALLVAVSLVAASLSSPVQAQAQPRCDLCRSPIAGKYVTYKLENTTLTVCAACDRRYPHCATCGLPFKETPVAKGGRTLCPRCVPTAVTCAICGRLVQGSYTVIQLPNEQMVVCAACKTTAPRCAACQRPLRPSEGERSGTRLLCPDCSRDLPVCETCGEKIVGTRYMMRFRPGEFCESCWTNRPVCSMCGAPCPDKPTRLDDGRPLCGRCAENPVVKQKTIEDIFAKVQPFLEKELGKPLKRPITLRLVGPDEIDKLPPSFPKGKRPVLSDPSDKSDRSDLSDSAEFASAGSSPNRRVQFGEGRGQSEKELGKFVRQGNRFEIRVLSGQPEDWAWETIAHEFAHAWQSEFNPRLNDPAWEEGFAQWAAELVLHWRGETDTLERLRLRTDFYGQAFRLLNQYEARRGKQGVLHAILTITNDPLPGR